MSLPAGASTYAAAAVLPETEDVDIVVDDADPRIDTIGRRGGGGQHLSKTDSAVRITHLPTGIVVTSSKKSRQGARSGARRADRGKKNTSRAQPASIC